MVPSNWWDLAEHGEQVDGGKPAGGDLQPLPQGRHVVTIKRVINGDERLEFHLAPDDRSKAWVFPKLYRENDRAKGLFIGLAGALELSPADLQQQVESGDIVGRKVVARVYHVEKDGRHYVNVGSFHRVDETPPAAKPKPAAPKPPKWESDDSIPF